MSRHIADLQRNHAYHYPSLSKRREQAEDKANEAKQSPKAVARKSVDTNKKETDRVLSDAYHYPSLSKRSEQGEDKANEEDRVPSDAYHYPTLTRKDTGKERVLSDAYHYPSLSKRSGQVEDKQM